MSPRASNPYWLSKWTCPVHGKYEAKTKTPASPADPVICPECRRGLQFEGQTTGRTTMPLPWVGKPRIPQKERVEPVASDNRPLKKRGKSW
jgi:hypothetical protein